jgi:hypothetical protein
MLTKLTLTIEETVIAQAKEYAQKRNRSVSRIVEEYLRSISDTSNDINFLALKSPKTDSISGIFADDGRPYEEMLEEAVKEKFLP